MPMNSKIAAVLFLGVSIVLALLLLSQVVTPLIGGFLFAVALATLGVFSKGFTKGV